MAKKEEKQKPIDKQRKRFFLTINNPIEKGFTHERIVEIIHKDFNFEYFAMVDEIGLETKTYHLHLFIILKTKKRFSSVRNAFPAAHIESEVQGTNEQCVAYLRKEGTHADKSDTQVEGSFYEEGILPVHVNVKNKAEIFFQIKEMINEGLKPEEIMQQSLVFRQYSKLIWEEFYAKRLRETPAHRDVRVIFHLGASGSGKSFTYVRLCDEFGDDAVYRGTDYANNCTALFDNYEAQEILFLDEIKPDSFHYGYLLNLLDGYKAPLHARYSNKWSLFREVHLVSVYAPEQLFENMVELGLRSTDSEKQLLRRITNYVYHWKDDTGYHQYEIEAKDYHGLEDLRNKALNSDGFESTTDNDEIPFNDSKKKGNESSCK